MSLINVESLKTTTLVQTFQLKKPRLTIEAVRPLLYMHNDPVGTFHMDLKYAGNVLATADFDMAAIKAGASFNDNEFHYGFITLQMGVVLNSGNSYSLELRSTGYNFNAASYLGWIKEHENFTNSFSAPVDSFQENPFGYQIWGY